MRSAAQVVETQEVARSRAGLFATRSLQVHHLRFLVLALDVTLLFVAGYLAIARTESAGGGVLHGTRILQAMTGIFILGFFAVLCWASRIHNPLKLVQRRWIPQIGRAVVCFGAPAVVPILVCLAFWDHADPVVRTTLQSLVMFEMAAVAFAVGSRGMLLAALPALNGRQLYRSRIAIVGSGESARRLIDWIEHSASELFEVIGVFDDRSAKRIENFDVARKIRGTTLDLIELFKFTSIDKVVVALPHHAEDRLLNVLQRLRKMPVDIALAPDLVGFHRRDQQTADLAGLKLLSLAHRPIRQPRRFMKDVFDVLVSGVALVFGAPVLLAIAVLIKLDSPGPVFFRQARQGLGDRIIHVFKFRTMRVEMADINGSQQTLRNDPRVTRLGAWLRRTSLDEVPQLINVLRGEMSLVGPRPHTPHMLIGNRHHYEIISEYSFRHRVKPGITGLAQVSGLRGAVDTPEQLRARVEMDLRYIDNWSLWLDIKILYRTFIVCISGTNAF